MCGGIVNTAVATAALEVTIKKFVITASVVVDVGSEIVGVILGLSRTAELEAGEVTSGLIRASGSSTAGSSANNRGLSLGLGSSLRVLLSLVVAAACLPSGVV